MSSFCLCLFVTIFIYETCRNIDEKEEEAGMPGQNDNLGLQQQKNRVDQILHSEATRVATDLSWKEQGYDNTYNSVESTKEDVKFIDQVLNLPATARMQFEDKDLFRLKAIQGRNLSHLLLNEHKYGEDSDEMLAVKERVAELEQVMSQKVDHGYDFETIERAYQRAIAACRYYCENKNPTFPAGIERKKRVMETFLRLKEENEQIAVAKDLIQKGELEGVEVKDPQDLLVLAQVHLSGNDDAIEELNEKEAAGIHALTFEDFAKMVGTKNRGAISFSDGKMHLVSNSWFAQTGMHDSFSMLFGSDNPQTLLNRQMQVRLYELVKERLDGINPEFLESVRIELKLDNGASKAAPLSRKTLADIIAKAGYIGSQVARVLWPKDRQNEQELPEDQQAQQRARYQLAEEARKLFDIGKEGADSSEQAQMALYAANEKQREVLRGKVKDILKQGKKLGVHVPSLSEHQMDNLVNSNLALVRDQIFAAMDQLYQMTTHLRKGVAVDSEKIAADQKITKKIAALVISRFVADSAEGKELSEYELQTNLREMAFQLLKQQQPGLAENLQKNCENMYVGKLAVGGSDGLDLAVERRLAGNKEWNRRIGDVRKGTETLRTLCDHMRELAELQDTAFDEGLSEAEAQRMRELGTQIQKIFTEDTDGSLAFVAKNLKSARFAQGYAQAKKLIDKNFSFEEAAKQLSEAANCRKEEQEKKQQAAYEPGIDEKLSMLEESAKNVAEVLLFEKMPVDLIKDSGDEASQSLVRMREVLRMFPAGKVYSKDVHVAGVHAKFVQKTDNSLYFVVGKQAIPLTRTAQQIADFVEDDMLEHVSLYGEEHAQNILKDLDFGDENPSLKLRSTNLCIKYLSGKTGKPGTYFTNVSDSLIRTLATHMMSGAMDAQEVEEFVDQTIESTVHINGAETLELLEHVEKNVQLREHVVIEKKPVVLSEDEKKKPQWNEEETKVQNLIADILYSKDTWNTDKYIETPGKRMQELLKEHIETLVLLLNKPHLLTQMLDKLPLPKEEKKEGQPEASDSIKAQVEKGIQTMLDLNEVKGLKLLYFDALKRNALLLALNSDSMLEKLSGIETEIDEAVQKAAEAVQEQVREAAETIFGGVVQDEQQQPLEDPNEPGISEGEKKERILASKERLHSILENAAKGSEGQGLFIKNVLSNYFVKVPSLDQRAMLASAVRNAKPMPEMEHLSEEQKQKKEREEMGNFLGGMLKGAGPLLQKMLQGMPAQSMPEELKGALEDMKSNLAPIPERVVRAQMQNIIDRSDNKITDIQVTKALGAASVGQTFLCKIFGPGMEEGKDIVVKLLRPDVRNRMMREKETMLWCARKTDGNVDENGDVIHPGQKGGMEATYEGQLLRIEEELDLTIEARNAQRGCVYDKGFQTIQAMKVNHLVQPTANALVLEKAPGTTVDKYLKELEDQEKALMSQFYVIDKVEKIQEDGTVKEEEQIRTREDGVPELLLSDKNINQWGKTRENLTRLLEQVQKRQKYLTQLVQSWVSEGIYGSGFYHGDLHAGNIMMDDQGLTVIDFGNATKLEEEQKKHVTRMMIAAVLGKVDIFEDSFHELLENTPESVYKQKREQLLTVFQEVMSLGDRQSAGERIAAALLKAQALGIELPPAIFNFSQCQIRLQNAVDEMNERIQSLQYNIRRVDRMKINSSESKDVFRMHLTFRMDEEPLHKELGEIKQEYVPLDKEKMLTDLRKKDASKNFKETYMVKNFAVYSIFKEIDTMITDTRKAQASPEFIDSMRSGAISMIEDTKEIFPDDESYQEVKKELLACLDHWEDQERQKRIFGRLYEMPSVVESEELEQSMKALRTEQNKEDANPEELERLEREFCDRYERLYDKKMMSGFHFISFLEALDSQKENVVQEVNQDMEAWFADKEELGEELCTKLRSTFEALRTAQSGTAPDTEQKKAAFLKVYCEALYLRLSVLQEKAKIKVDDAEPDSFTDVMGTLVQSYVKTSIRQLGRWNAYWNRKALENEQ